MNFQSIKLRLTNLNQKMINDLSSILIGYVILRQNRLKHSKIILFKSLNMIIKYCRSGTH